jgi:hypothetical protein
MHDDTAIHEEFECARERAVALTDEYFARPADDPLREFAWYDVSSETERARLLLERWLAQPEARARMSSAREPVLVLA